MRRGESCEGRPNGVAGLGVLRLQRLVVDYRAMDASEVYFQD